MAKKSTIQLSLFDFNEPEQVKKVVEKPIETAIVKAPTPPTTEVKKVNFVMPQNVNTHIINVGQNTNTKSTDETLQKIEAPIIEDKNEIIEEQTIIGKKVEKEIITAQVIENINDTIEEKAIIQKQLEPEIIEETSKFNTIESLPKLPSAQVVVPIIIQENNVEANQPQQTANTIINTEEPKPIKRPKAETANTKPKTVNAQMLQKRGRKSQAVMASEASFVNIPADDVLFSKHYYSIGQVAAMFNANVSKIRFWEEQLSSLLKVRKNRKGDRYFTPENIKNLAQIYNLTSKQGLTMSGAAKYLQDQKNNINQNENLLQELSQLKQFLLGLETGLKA